MADVKISLVFPEELLAEVDEVAAVQERSRAATLRVAAREYVERHRHAVTGEGGGRDANS